MKTWRSKESKLLSQRSYPERAGHQAVLLCWLEAEGPGSTTRTGNGCHLSQETCFCISHFFFLHHSMFFATVSCNLPQCETVYVYRCIYTQKCKHLMICWSIQLHSVQHWGGRIISPWQRWPGLNAWSVSVTQSCPTLCDPTDYSPPGTPVQGIFQARILEWVVIPFSRGSSLPRDQTWVSCIAHKFFTIWATRKGPGTCEHYDITYKEEVRLQMELMLPIIWL